MPGDRVPDPLWWNTAKPTVRNVVRAPEGKRSLFPMPSIGALDSSAFPWSRRRLDHRGIIDPVIPVLAPAWPSRVRSDGPNPVRSGSSGRWESFASCLRTRGSRRSGRIPRRDSPGPGRGSARGGPTHPPAGKSLTISVLHGGTTSNGGFRAVGRRRRFPTGGHPARSLPMLRRRVACALGIPAVRALGNVHGRQYN